MDHRNQLAMQARAIRHRDIEREVQGMLALAERCRITKPKFAAWCRKMAAILERQHKAV